MPSFVVGDVHGCRDALVRLLGDTGLVDGHERWSGADARLWLLGDLADRGPDGVGVIDLVMRLEREAAGNVRCLLGNHDALIRAAARFADDAVDASGVSFREIWMMNGGSVRDLERLEPHHLAWIERMPAVARDGEWLVLHADTDAYLGLGATSDAVNEAVREVFADGGPAELGRLDRPGRAHRDRNLNLCRGDADRREMEEGNRVEDYDLDVLVRRFKEAEMRAFNDGRAEDASDWLIAQHLVCILRGDFGGGGPKQTEPSLHLVR